MREEATPAGGDSGQNAGLAALAATLGMLLFAVAVQQPLPVFFLALLGLATTTVAVLSSLRTRASFGGLFGISRFSGSVAAWCLVGLGVGAGLAFLFRGTSNQRLLLTGLEPFVLTAAAIGATEELLFRGFIQGRLLSLGWLVAVLLAALAHAAYKVGLFVFPPEGFSAHLALLGGLTFVVGAVFGVIRHISGSILPCVAAHAFFDILGYGDWVHPPWWVWG